VDIYYGNTQLASSGVEGPSGLRINGQQVVDEAGLFRASAQTFYGRGNKSTRVQFSRWRMFESVKAAEVHCARIVAELPVQADLLLVAGETGDQQDLRLPNAVFVSCDPQQKGKSVLTTFEFVGGIFLSEDVTIPDESDLVKAGTVDLTAAEESKAITFAVPFGATPSGVTATLLAPNLGAGFDVWIDHSTVSATGFTAIFADPVPGAGYKLSWIAVL
jgi:hypothetical protein